MTYNSDKYGFEQIKASKKINIRKKKNVKKTDQAVEFSKKIIATLENKVQDHNSNNIKKINLIQLKRIYRSVGKSFDNKENLNELALAKVNMFIRTISTGFIKENYTNGSDDIIQKKYITIIQASFKPQEQDFEKAQKDIEKFNLNDFKFNNVDELYLDDEEDGVTIGYTI
jgi:hypothetical protein